jgi:uncharacterized protein (TIGR03083 family)
MPLVPLSPIDTRPLFRPVSTALVDLLRELDAADWQRPTIAGVWVVRDVVAHLVDLTFRRLSFHRDQMPPPPPATPINSERDFVRFIDTINAQWVDVSRRFSPRVLTDLYEKGGAGLADWFEALPLEAPALFGVSWAGEQQSEGWFDIGREFTELWHHQEQIRIAVGAPSLEDPRFLRAVIDVSIRVLPYTYRDVDAPDGTSMVFDVTGPSGGEWTLIREGRGWHLLAGATDPATTRIVVSDDAAWRLLFNAVKEEAVESCLRIEGDRDLAMPFVRARSVIV